MNLELFHVQTNTSFDVPDSLAIVLMGKFNEEQPPDIDLSDVPNADIISRKHAQIYVQHQGYFLEDLGSANGTFLNHQRLLPRTCYDLKLGDQIHLGQGNQVTLVFQQKDLPVVNWLPVTQIQPEISQVRSLQQRDRYSPANRFIGLSLMTLSILLLAANTRIGLFVGMPAILLCIAGLVMLVQTRYNPNWGWILIGLGIGTIVLSGRFFASANLLSVMVGAALFLVGYQLFSHRPILNSLGQALKQLFKS